MALKKFFAINLVKFDLFSHPSVLAFTQGLKNLPTFSSAFDYDPSSFKNCRTYGSEFEKLERPGYAHDLDIFLSKFLRVVQSRGHFIIVC